MLLHASNIDSKTNSRLNRMRIAYARMTHVLHI